MWRTSADLTDFWELVLHWYVCFVGFRLFFVWLVLVFIYFLSRTVFKDRLYSWVLGVIFFPGHVFHTEDPQAKENHSEKQKNLQNIEYLLCGSKINVCLKGKGSEEQLSSPVCKKLHIRLRIYFIYHFPHKSVPGMLLDVQAGSCLVVLICKKSVGFGLEHELLRVPPWSFFCQGLWKLYYWSFSPFSL